jgi:hypothetical protein
MVVKVKNRPFTRREEMLKDAKLIVVQFSFAKLNQVPAWLPEKNPKARTENPAQGVCIVEPMEKVDTTHLLIALNNLGYELVDAFHEQRPNKNGYGTYQMCRFVFEKNPEPEKVLAQRLSGTVHKILGGFNDLCFLALWRVRAFRNPLFKNGQIQPDGASVSINLEARVPLVQADGTPVKVWEKDQDGNRLGTEPKPISPLYTLQVTKEAIKLQSL